MKKDIKYAAVLKNIKVNGSIAMRQAQGTLVREFKITLLTAGKATDRIFNGSIDSSDNDVPPLLQLSECKTFFVDVDQEDWHQMRKHFALKNKAYEQGVLSYISSARHKKMLKLNSGNIK